MHDWFSSYDSVNIEIAIGCILPDGGVSLRVMVKTFHILHHFPVIQIKLYKSTNVAGITDYIASFPCDSDKTV